MVNIPMEPANPSVVDKITLEHFRNTRGNWKETPDLWLPRQPMKLDVVQPLKFKRSPLEKWWSEDDPFFISFWDGTFSRASC